MTSKRVCAAAAVCFVFSRHDAQRDHSQGTTFVPSGELNIGRRYGGVGQGRVEYGRLE